MSTAVGVTGKKCYNGKFIWMWNWSHKRFKYGEWTTMALHHNVIIIDGKTSECTRCAHTILNEWRDLMEALT